jgi:hypothetical protein
MELGRGPKRTAALPAANRSWQRLDRIRDDGWSMPQRSLFRDRARAFVLSTAIHAIGLLLLLLIWTPSPGERPPIRVTLLHADASAPDPEPPPEPLRFRKVAHPRVRESLDLPREVVALAPPPADADLTEHAMGGGFGVEVLPAGSFPGLAIAGTGAGLAGSGLGAGNAAAPEGTFQEYVGGLRQAGLDVVFVIDATGSMGWLIDDVKARVRALADWIRRLVPVTRFGIVAYRDDGDPEFLTRVLPLTLNIGKVRRFLDHLEARGGGDIPEAVAAGLRAAISKPGWKGDSQKIIVIVGDAPPHPDDLETALASAREFRAKGGKVTTVDVSFDANPQIAANRLGKRVDQLETVQQRGVMPEFLRIATAGGGDASNLEGERRVVRQLAVLIFGQRWSEDVRPLLGDL